MKRLISTFAALAMIAALAAPSQAQMSFGLGSVSVGAAFVSPDNVDATFGIVGGAEIGTLMENVTARVDLMWWGKSQDVLGTDWSWRDIAILPGARYDFPMGDGGAVTPFVNGGLGVHLFKTEFELFGQTADASSTEIGFFVGGGADYEMSDTMTLNAFADYHLMDLNFFAIGAGVTFDM